MLKLGIIGDPLEHTLSPVMHNAALQYLNISGEYKAYEVKENELEESIKKLKGLGLKGFNVTIPHKTKIIPLINKLTETAKLTNAVNTITILEDGKTIGDNTDVIGFWEAIPEEITKKIPEENITIIGCGGSAYAVAIALLLNKAKSMNIYARNKEKLTKFKKFIEATKEQIIDFKSKTNIEISLFDKVNLSNTFMLVNTTPLGMFPHTHISPVVKEELKKLPSNAFVYDIIYNPQETKLLKDAKSLGLQTLNGVEMLIRQGAASLGIWLNLKEAPIGIMKLALNQYLENGVYSK